VAFGFKTLQNLQEKLAADSIKIPLAADVSPLFSERVIYGRRAANRIVIHPMEGCDGTPDGKPDDLTARRYTRFAQSGAGIIWFEAVSILPEARANPRQLYLHDGSAEDFRRLTEHIKQTCFRKNGYEPLIILQATHSGRYAKPRGIPAPIIACHNTNFERERPLPDSAIVTDDELRTAEQRFGQTAKLAKESGFDGIDIKACHGYLLGECLSAFTRPGPYGGSFENRTRLLKNAIQAASAHKSPGFFITARIGAYDGFEYPYGFGARRDGQVGPDYAEAITLCDLLREQYGLELVNITIGNPYQNPHVNRPYDSGISSPPENPLGGVERLLNAARAVQKAVPSLSVTATGFSYLRQFGPNAAAAMLKQGDCAFAGFGRQAIAYPCFVEDLRERGALKPEKCCVTCSKCTQLMRAGSAAGCVVRDSEVYLPLYKESVLKA
jgi:2,4-dienoyl-CoA reductase-like NADH-dependent reductase (Old Yellow Enzyme family)